MMNNPEFKRFRELLPFWLNDNLDNDDQQFMNGFLEQHPEHKTEVAFNLALRDSVKAVGEKRDENIGLQRLLDSIHAERQS